jgi:hypothetical protein
MAQPLWQAKSLKDFTRLEQARPAQAQDLGNGAFRAEVRFGDVVPGYTDSRTLWDVSQHLFHEGDESWFGLSVTIPADWIGWFPKNDELGNWPGNRFILKGGQHGGSFFEWHHGPENGDWNDPMLGGSAPLYVVATDRDIKLYLVDPAVGPRPDATWTLVADFERGRPYDIVIGNFWSTDPRKGWVEAHTDAQQVVPRFLTSTLYPPPRPPTFVYAQVGLYRRGFIGDPTIAWPQDAKPGTSYPPRFVPRKGMHVYPEAGGYPQTLQLQDLRLGRAKEDVMRPIDVVKPDPPAPDPAPDPVTPDVPAEPAEKPSIDPVAGASLLMRIRDDINALLGKGPYKPAG